MKTWTDFKERILNETYNTPITEIIAVLERTINEWQAELEWRQSLPMDAMVDNTTKENK